jgi:hypothetical protein
MWYMYSRPLLFPRFPPPQCTETLFSMVQPIATPEPSRGHTVPPQTITDMRALGMMLISDKENKQKARKSRCVESERGESPSVSHYSPQT